MGQMLKPYLTAINRKTESTPVRWLLDQGLIKGDVLDYGCGKGKCAEVMGADKYDPYHYRAKLTKKYDTITCNYVLNVITLEEGKMVIQKILNLLKDDGVAYISVRRDVEGETRTAKKTRQIDVQLDYPSIMKTSTYEIYKVKKGQ